MTVIPQKRSIASADMQAGTQSVKPSPYLNMFEDFRSELDEHHDRRERVIKASRDITALAKKIIFALQRVQKLRAAIPQSLMKQAIQHQGTIKANFKTVSTDLQGINAYRYARNISGGIQEYLEALTFQYYLEEQQIMKIEKIRDLLSGFAAEGEYIEVNEEDYLGGLFDMTGEVMRFAITNMTTMGITPGRTDDSRQDMNKGGEDDRRSVLDDLQLLRLRLEMLDAGSNSWLARDMGKKLEVTQASVSKVERSLYDLVVRGSERPEGWLPDVKAGRRVAEGDPDAG